MRSFIFSHLTLPVLLTCIIASADLEQQQQPQCSTMIRHKQSFKWPFELGPGECIDRYGPMQFPKGHIGIKSFWAEMVDENEVPVPVSELYIHHYTAAQYYVNASEPVVHLQDGRPTAESAIVVPGNQGLCKNFTQFFGVGSESRNTVFRIPGDYAVQIEAPGDVPPGYTSAWYLEIHSMSIKGTEDPLKCLECACEMYNVTTDPIGNPLPKDYKGGFLCCYDGGRCRLAQGYSAPKKKYYFKYTVEWVDWDDRCVFPVRSYVLDATDTRDGDLTIPEQCEAEYFVPQCSSLLKEHCVYVRENYYRIPIGGNVLLGTAHNHIGGLGVTVYGEDGRLICASTPVYGNGSVTEGGYLVEMGQCSPEFGSVTIKDNERLLMKSYYKNDIQHTGVMSLFIIVIADETEKSSGSLLDDGHSVPIYAK